MIKSVSSVLLYVSDVDPSSRFYQKLGFQKAGSDPGRREVRLNWFRLQFVDKKSATEPEIKAEALAEPKGSGLYIGISVDNFDDFRKAVRAKGIKFSGQPTSSSRGNRQVSLKDPDGYNLMLFESQT